MIKKISQIIVTLLILILLLPSVNIQASGKVEAKIGDKVTLQGEDVKAGSTYKWNIKKGSEIIATQTNPIFNYTFVEQGEYNVNLVVTDINNNIKITSILVLVGDRYPRPAGEEGAQVGTALKPGPLTVDLATLPVMQPDGTVHLLGDGKVLFDIDVTRADILEYRIDRNIFADSDGNGIANDDIDNASDDSYLLGGIWQTEYISGESSKIVAEITLVTNSGEKAKQQVEMIFDKAPSREGDPVAIMEVLPYPTAENGLIYLYDEEETVGLYARKSTGNIIEYRIDNNIFVDSDKDGNPANDIDNINDISFKTGDVFRTTYTKTDQQIIAQLIVVGEGGKGSRVQRGIVFTDKPKPSIEEITSQEMVYFSSDKSFVLKGDAITFSVEGLKNIEEYIFDWDFDGDGFSDKTTEGINSVIHIYEVADIYDSKVKITDLNGDSIDYTLSVLVKDVLGTFADFQYEIDGNTVIFTNISEAAINLADKELDYTWSFGDTDAEGFEKQSGQVYEVNPEYVYNKAGTYLVSLTVTDSDDVTHTKTAEIIIENDLVVGTGEEITEDVTQSEDEKEGGSIIVKILKIFLYLILIIIILAVSIFGGFLVFLKVQHPDLTIEELIDEVKIKILGMMGVNDMIEEHPLADQSIEEKPIEGPTVELPEQEEKESNIDKDDGSVPDWMKANQAPSTQKKEVIEGEFEEEPSDDQPDVKTSAKEETDDKNDDEPPKGGGEPPLAKSDGPVPDWLKNS